MLLCMKYQRGWLTLWVWCQSLSQKCQPHYLLNLFKKLVCPSGGRNSKEEAFRAFWRSLFFPQGGGARFLIKLLDDLVNIQFWILACTHLKLLFIYVKVHWMYNWVSERGESVTKSHEEESVCIAPTEKYKLYTYFYTLHIVYELVVLVSQTKHLL